LSVELATGQARSGERDLLDTCGLVVANPPHTLNAELGAILPVLTPRLATHAGARYRLELLMLQKPRREAT
ncbi:MAG TPA: hypothetical protein VFR19_22250, partial [Hyphomicrobiaceae bacterium]|nr:hypothetical protein [Hyphomicrobiaceae bacterium]